MEAPINRYGLILVASPTGITLIELQETEAHSLCVRPASLICTRRTARYIAATNTGGLGGLYSFPLSELGQGMS
jgi:hypothetical protein